MSIRFEHVSKAFGSRTILRDVSFTVERGEILFILGQSGMGKSVTLKHMIGLLKPDAGAVWVNQTRVDEATPQALALVRQECGMVFQHPALLDSLSVFDNVAFGLRAQALSLEHLRARVIEHLALVHLGPEILDRLPADISYGMQKRVSLARTLAPRPRALLFDEPTTGLDPITTGSINRLIVELSRKLQTTSIVVSHDMKSALETADRILVLDQAQVIALESPTELRKNSHPLIRAFLREAQT